MQDLNPTVLDCPVVTDVACNYILPKNSTSPCFNLNTVKNYNKRMLHHERSDSITKKAHARSKY